MKEVIEVIAKALVDDPASVKVEETIDGDTTVCTLSVAEADMGKVIGKSGKIAKAIRSIIKSASIRAEKKVVLEIKFVYIPNKNNGNICFAEPTPFKQWYKKKDNDYYFLYADNFENTKSNMVLAEKIAKENGFTECKNGLR